MVLRRQMDDIAARERASPEGDALRVDAIERARERDGCAPILHLLRRRDDLARATCALAEEAVVEREHRQPGVNERDCVGHHELLGAGEPVAHDDAR